MKYPGQPESAPGWYRQRQESYIENKFSESFEELANAIQAEHWFGDPTQHSRFRVDFLLKDARLIVELDGHKTHFTQEQRQNDAVRQRYLTRAGYSVLRFTGREIIGNISRCLDELRIVYEEKKQLKPAKYRAMYIDYRFFQMQMYDIVKFYKHQLPERNLSAVPLNKFIPHAVEWLREKSFVTAFVFGSREYLQDAARLHDEICDYPNGEVRINIIEDALYTLALGDHLKAFCHLFDEFYLIADDPVYVEPLITATRDKFDGIQTSESTTMPVENAKLLRKGNHETSYVGSELVRVRWQDIIYPITASIGLKRHEL